MQDYGKFVQQKLFHKKELMNAKPMSSLTTLSNNAREVVFLSAHSHVKVFYVQSIFIYREFLCEIHPPTVPQARYKCITLLMIILVNIKSPLDDYTSEDLAPPATDNTQVHPRTMV